MNRYIRRIIVYIKMTTLLTVMGAVVLFIAGIPVAAYVKSKGSQLIYQGAPESLLQTHYDLTKLVNKEDTTPGQSEDRDAVSSARIGAVECDRIALSAPLYDDDSDELLIKGIGHYPESGLPGGGKPILISGHDSTFFAPLEQIAIGDVIRVVMEDKDYYYSIVTTKVALATDTSAYDLSQNKEQLILYTCYPFGKLLRDQKERFFVYGEPITTDEAFNQE
jgi:sortase A